MTRRGGIAAHQSPLNETDVWLTPPDVLAAVGGPASFDLDPCACQEPRPWPTARHHYTVENDGLSKQWFGRVWCNPPYGGPSIIGPWMRRMAAYGRGTALIFARTETAVFFETVWRSATACFFLEGRLFFHYRDGQRAPNNSGAPSALVAYGRHDAEVLRNCALPGQYVELSGADAFDQVLG